MSAYYCGGHTHVLVITCRLARKLLACELTPRHGRAFCVALKCMRVYSMYLLDYEECLPIMVVDTSPPLPFMQTGRVRGLHPLSTLFAAFQKPILTVQSIEPTSRRYFKFLVDHSIG